MWEPDVIIVGAGSAGCVVTRRLIDRGDAKVLLLEAGGPDDNPAIHDPGRFHELWLVEEDWAHYTVPQRYAADRKLHWPRGRVLGGSSSLNGLMLVGERAAEFIAGAHTESPAGADALRERVEWPVVA